MATEIPTSSSDDKQVNKADSGGSMGMSGIAGVFTKGFDQTEGAIVDYVNMKQRQKQRELEERKYREQMAMESEQFKVKSQQNQQQINQGNRDRNLSAIDMLSKQRGNAVQRAATQTVGNFKTDFYKAVTG